MVNDQSELYHYGVKGMKWGVRRYQPYGKGGYNPTTISYTEGAMTATLQSKEFEKLAEHGKMAVESSSDDNHTVVTGHQSTPKESEPNSTVDHVDEHTGETTKRVFYDEEGKMKRDIHTSDHGNPKDHDYPEDDGAHATDYIWENGEIVGKEDRPLTDEERKENEDILRKKKDE